MLEGITKTAKIPEYATYVKLIASDLFTKCSEMYMDLSADDLTADKWPGGVSPKMQQYAQFFNKLSQSLTTQILAYGNEDAQKAMIKFFLDIASESYSRGNFTAVEAIWTGGLLSEVFNLKDKSGNSLLDVVGKESPYSGIIEKLREYSKGSNFANKRKIYDDLAAAGKPFIPYLGIYLTDLTFTRDGNPDKIVVKGKDTCNFKKLALLHEVTRKALSGKTDNLKSNSRVNTSFIDIVDSLELASAQRLLFMRKSIDYNSLYATLGRAQQMFVLTKFNAWSKSGTIDKDLDTAEESTVRTIKLQFENKKLACKLAVEDSIKELRKQLGKAALQNSDLNKLLSVDNDLDFANICKGLDVEKGLIGVDDKIISSIRKIQTALVEESRFSSILKQISDAQKNS